MTEADSVLVNGILNMAGPTRSDGAEVTVDLAKCKLLAIIAKELSRLADAYEEVHIEPITKRWLREKIK